MSSTSDPSLSNQPTVVTGKDAVTPPMHSGPDYPERAIQTVENKQPAGTVARTQTLGQGIPTQEPTALEEGTLVKGRYEVERRLGQGGIGVVYLARDRQLLDRRVVIKTLIESSLRNEWIAGKFQHEIEALSRLDHPGIVGVLDTGTLANGQPFFVMQFVEGKSLRSAIDPAGMDLVRTGQILRQIGAALAAAHEKGIVHRDLKPENIMLQVLAGGGEQVKLIDFGLAKVEKPLTADVSIVGRPAGTIRYMSPEQLYGVTSPASDIYSMGVIAYEMLVGRCPFIPGSQFQHAAVLQLSEMQKAGLRLKPRDLRPELSVAVEAAILKALAFDPLDRFSSARNFGETMAVELSAAEPASAVAESVAVLVVGVVSGSDGKADAELIRRLFDIARQGKTQGPSRLTDGIFPFQAPDGMVLVFYRDPELAIRFARNLARDVKDAGRLRMALHAGPVRPIGDFETNEIVTGPVVDLAQAVKQCGDPGHILVTGDFFSTVAGNEKWAGRLTDLGECEVQPGSRVKLFNLVQDEVGNPRRPSGFSPHPSVTEPPRRIAAGIVTAIAVAMLLAVISGLWWTTKNKQSPMPAGNAPAAPTLRLAYSIAVQKYRDGKPYEAPFQLAREINFEKDYQVRLNVAVPTDGYLYILNEGPVPVGAPPSYNILFPSETTNGGSALVTANRRLVIPEASWFRFDGEEGTEKLWLVWAVRPIDLFESVKRHANARERGEIADPSESVAIERFLREWAAKAPMSEKDEAARETILRTNGPILVTGINLEHH